MAVLCRPWDLGNSQAGLGIVGVLLVAFSAAAGLGFCALLGFPFSAASTQVLPFLALGLSMENMFIILQTARECSTFNGEQTQKHLRRVSSYIITYDSYYLYIYLILFYFVDIRNDYYTRPYSMLVKLHAYFYLQSAVGGIIKRSGVSILMTSTCTCIGFACAAIIPVPALRSMCLQAAILIFVNLAVTLMVFPACISLDFRRRQAKRADILCCFSSPEPLENSLPAFYSKTSDTTCCLPPNTQQTKTGTHIEGKNQEDQTSMSQSRTHNFSSQYTTAPSVASSLGSTRSLVGEGLGVKTCLLNSCRKLWLAYISCVTGERFRAVGIILLLASLAASIWGVSRLKDGLSLTSLVPRESLEARFLQAQQKHFSIYQMFAVTKGFEYPRYQSLIHEYHSAFTRVPYIIKDDDGGLPDSWLAKFRDWLLGLQKAFDRDWQRGAIVADKWHANATDEGVLAYKLLVQTGHVDHPVDKSLLTQVNLLLKVDNY